MPKGAAWCAAQAVHAAWRAENADARRMTDARVKSYRKSEGVNASSHDEAEARHKFMAPENHVVRADPRHAKKSYSETARLIDRHHWNTTRKCIGMSRRCEQAATTKKRCGCAGRHEECPAA